LFLFVVIFLRKRISKRTHRGQTKEVVHKMFERLWKKIEEQFNTQFEVEGMDPVEPLDRDLAQRMQEIDARVEAAAGRIREIRQEVQINLALMT